MIKLPNIQAMTDAEFVGFCYEFFFARPADDLGQSAQLQRLADGQLTRADLIMEFLNSDEYRNKNLGEEFVPSGHFYSAVPSFADRVAVLENNAPIGKSLGEIDTNEAQQLAMLEAFKRYHDDCPFPVEQQKGFRYYFDNPAYSFTDGLVLYSMMRYFKPNKIIEVGSGFSSCAMLDTNELYFDNQIELTFIEPYADLLRKLNAAETDSEKIIDQPVQEVDLEVFSKLEENDILFIDSTHVGKLNSDVNYLLFTVLPHLADGVIIHFHDIFWPFEYPKNWIEEGRAWNEAYFLHAFLMNNARYKILFFASYLHQFYAPWIAQKMPKYLLNAGGNIWLKKGSLI